jgi:hypothetical protein
MQGCTHFFKKSKSHFKILGSRRVTWSKFHIQDPEILGATVRNVVVTAWHLAFVHPWRNVWSGTVLEVGADRRGLHLADWEALITSVTCKRSHLTFGTLLFEQFCAGLYGSKLFRDRYKASFIQNSPLTL